MRAGFEKRGLKFFFCFKIVLFCLCFYRHSPISHPSPTYEEKIDQILVEDQIQEMEVEVEVEVDVTPQK